jgi:hypothetical protein
MAEQVPIRPQNDCLSGSQKTWLMAGIGANFTDPSVIINDSKEGREHDQNCRRGKVKSTGIREKYST